MNDHHPNSGNSSVNSGSTNRSDESTSVRSESRRPRTGIFARPNRTTSHQVDESEEVSRSMSQTSISESSLSSSKSIWNKLEQDERRKARLRKRLNNIRTNEDTNDANKDISTADISGHSDDTTSSEVRMAAISPPSRPSRREPHQLRPSLARDLHQEREQDRSQEPSEYIRIAAGQVHGSPGRSQQVIRRSRSAQRLNSPPQQDVTRHVARTRSEVTKMVDDTSQLSSRRRNRHRPQHSPHGSADTSQHTTQNNHHAAVDRPPLAQPTPTAPRQPLRQPSRPPLSPVHHALSDMERKIQQHQREIAEHRRPSPQSTVHIHEETPSSTNTNDPTHDLEVQKAIDRQYTQSQQAKTLDSPTTPSRPSSSRSAHLRHKPGAYCVDGPDSALARQREQELSYSPPQSPTPTISAAVRSIKSVPVAAMIVEDFEKQEFTQREKELKAQEARLAEQAAKLKAWEEELERKRRLLEQPSASVVRAQIVEEEEVKPPSSGRSLLYWKRNHSRPANNYASSSGGGSSSVSDGAVVVELGAPLSAVFDSHPLDQQSVATGSHSIDTTSLSTDLGPGPLRFAPQLERSLEEQLMELDATDRRIYKNLKQRWQDHQAKLGAHKKPGSKAIFDMPIEWHLRYLRMCAKKNGSFSEERAWSCERKLRKRFLILSVFPLTEQLKSKTLFPVPGLRTKDGHDMFYMRPSRYFPHKTSTRTIIDNLCYVMNTMLEKEHATQEGIGFIACMDNWKMKNFDVNYCYQFMMALQGFMVPVKTQLFLIVNPPGWFGVIWRIMKPMLAPSFRKRVKICKERKIAKYLEPGYQAYLPDDMLTGKANTDAMVADFIAYRQSVERRKHHYSDSDDGQSSGHPYDSSSKANSFDDDLGMTAGSHWVSSEGSEISSHDGDPRQYAVEVGGHGDYEDEDDASIECDIMAEDIPEHEEMKQAATPGGSRQQRWAGRS